MPETEPDSKQFTVDQTYRDNRLALQACVERAKELSRAYGGRYTVDGRIRWGCTLFLRLVVNGLSILRLAPDPEVSESGAHWDLSSVASLVRNLHECYFTFFYLCVDKVEEDEWLARLTLLQLHDNQLRMDVFTDWGINDTSGFLQHRDKLTRKLQTSKYFAGLTEKQQRRYLAGGEPIFLTRNEIIARMGDDIQVSRGVYRYLSGQTHSFPISFFRSGEGGRGSGVENPADKGLMAVVINFATHCLERALSEFPLLFSQGEAGPELQEGIPRES